MSYPRWFRTLAYLDRLPEVIRCVLVFHAPGALIARYLCIGRQKYPYDLKTRQGQRMTMQSYHDVVTAWVIFCRQEYGMPASMRTILDIGANYGAFSVWASQHARAAAIVAVEPFPDCFARLHDHVEKNRLTDRVTIWNAGLGQCSQVRYIHGQISEEPGSPSQSRPFVGAEIQEPDAVEVPIFSMVDLVTKACTAMNCDEIDFVKLDIEGIEHTALTADAGRALQRIRHLSLEYHPNGSKAALFEILEKAGLHCTADLCVSENSGVARFTREPSKLSCSDPSTMIGR